MPRYPEKRPTGGVHARRAFSLVLSLTVMAMLLILCVGAAALLSMELRVAQSSVSMTRARLNAMLGARVALGEIQRLMGPDQRVSATADILGNPDVTDPSQASAYTSSVNGIVVHPRWVGVWNTGPATADQAPQGASPEEQNKLFYRTADGALKDARYVTDKTGTDGMDNWTRRRAGTTMAQSSRRLMGWLVSGSEALPRTDAAAPTPFSPYDANRDIVALGRGTMGSLFNENQTASDMLGARVRIVPIPNLGDAAASTTTLTGNSYAYWVADEGVKARFNIRDKYEAANIAPSPTTAARGEALRFLVSQTGKVSSGATRSPISGAPALPDITYSSGKDWDKVTSFDGLALADNPSSPASSQYQGSTYRPYYYHDFSFVSAGVDCDVENGGLKKDLTYYLQNNADIADYGAVPGSGVTAARAMLPISMTTGVTEPTITPVFPTFGLIKDWWRNAPSYSGTAQGGGTTTPRGPLTYNATYAQSTNMHGATNRTPLVVATPDLRTGATSQAARSPVITQVTMHFKPVYDGDTVSGMNARCLYYPQVVLWNPYSVPIRLNAASVDYLNNWAAWANINTSYSYVSMRTCWSFRLPAITINPGQSVSFAAVEETNLVGGPGTVSPSSILNTTAVVPMKVGVPTTRNYVVDSFTSTYASQGSKIVGSAPPVAACSLGYCNSIFSPGAYNEKVLATDQVILKDGNATLAHIKLDSLDPKQALMVNGDRRYANKPLDPPWDIAVLLTNLSLEPAPASNFDANCYGFRLKRLDSSEFQDTGAGGGAKRAAMTNPFVDMNVRSALQTRSPFDAQDMICPPSITKSMPPPSPFSFNFNVSGQYMGGMWTTDYTIALTPSGASASKMSPFFQNTSGGSSDYPGTLLYDVPYTEVGLQTLAQLDSAPLNPMSFGPSMPFGNAHIPLPDGTGLTDRTGYAQNELSNMWTVIAQWGPIGTTLEGLRATSRIGSQTSDIFDISYELNHALWDTYRFSGIPANNTGWNLTQSGWQNGDVNTPDRTLPSSRYEPAGNFPVNSGYFADKSYKLYHASYTLLEKGAFNVNSTSRVAWISLLTSCRNLDVPAINGNVANRQRTPFPRVLRPKGGAVLNGSGAFSENMWSGFRSLDDREIQVLADKIVAEVKRRGPFLSLSDFVNRRLKTPSASDYANWTLREYDYLGTLEAAIGAAEINAANGNNALMPRAESDKDFFLGNLDKMANQTAVKPQHRSRHRIAGAPGYLQQSDILRAVGNALSARSDTFTVRARGEFEGAVAWTEITVQRTPEPLIPGTGSTLPINPKSVQTGGAFAGNQFMGRRMRIVATRWLDTQNI